MIIPQGLLIYPTTSLDDTSDNRHLALNNQARAIPKGHMARAKRPLLITPGNDVDEESKQLGKLLAELFARLPPCHRQMQPWPGTA